MAELSKLLKKEGRQKGLQEGRKQKLARISIKLLTIKFGVLSEDIKKKLETSDTYILE